MSPRMRRRRCRTKCRSAKSTMTWSTVKYATSAENGFVGGSLHAASPEPDKVSLSESTITWSTVKYATDAQNGFVSGSLDKTIIVDRTFRTHVLENRYLKVTLVPEFGGRILSIIYKPTGHEQLYRTRSRRALRDEGRQFLLRLADGVWRHLSHFPGSRARQDVAEAVGFWDREGEARRSDGVDVAEGRFRISRGTENIQERFDGHRGDLPCDAESRSRRARYAYGPEKSQRHGDSLRVLDVHDAGAGIGPEKSQNDRRR